MKFWKKNQKKKAHPGNNRATIVLAIVFLLAGLLIYRLFDIQFLNKTRYITMAASQHGVSTEIEPVRGRIFIQDGKSGDNGKLYPIAANRKFAEIYVAPIDIPSDQIGHVSGELYENIFAGHEIIQNPEISQATDTEQAELSSAYFELEKLRFKEAKTNEIAEKLSRREDPYEPIAKKIDQAKAESILALRLPGVNYELKDFRFYPENSISSHITGFVGYSGEEKKGRYGLEGFFDKELSGQVGYIKGERDARGQMIAVSDMEWSEAKDGCDLVLTINRSIQYVACEKLKEAVLRHGARGGSVVAMDPNTGEIIAMCAYPDYDANNYQDVKDIYVYNNPAIFSQYEPGSIFKPLTMAAAIDQGKVGPNTTYKDHGSIMVPGWPKPIKNSDFESFGGHGVVNMNTVLELSLNTGAIFAMESIGAKTFAQYVQKFGFGEKTGIELETESPGNISNLLMSKIKEVDAAVASFGQGITVTPLQMVSSYAALANGGMLMKPFIVKSMSCGGGYEQEVKPKEIRRVMSERTSALISGMLVKVVEDGHAKGARIPGYFVAGKTGTAQVAAADTRGYGQNYIHSFAGYTPADNPRIVILTKIDEPQDVEYAEGSAVPLFNEIAKFILQYYEIPTEREVK